MKMLEKTFTKSGITYEQLRRIGNLAVYRRTNGAWTDYEVIRVQSHDGYEIAGKQIEPAEHYPSTASWGVNGWTYSTQLQALTKLLEVDLADMKPSQDAPRVLATAA